jgi:ThiF family
MKFNYVFLIGLGGTGSHLVGALVQLMRFHPEGTNNFYLIDGDVYEEKNATRQVIAEGHIGKNKARATAERLGGGTIKAIGEYIDKDSFTALLEANVTKDDNFLIVPCVDNHATRKATLEALEEGGYQNFVWISPGNSFDKGLVVLHIKEEGEALTVHPASKYHDFADPEDAIPVRGDGCINHIPSSPQLITANFTAACATLNSISNMLDEKGWYEEYHFSCRKNKLVPQLPLRGVLVV